ncbi:MAG: hypothetical protein FJ403_21720 [Verrucomicrobia bacterium]|nr:hypothetical protein [Verrucomicrobiota bacterium]
MTHKLDADDFFIHRIQQHCAERGLNFFLVEPEWVEAFYEKFRQRKVWARLLLNMHSEHHQPDDIYHKLVKLAFETKTQVIDPPDVALAAFNKAALHPRLQAAGFDLPATLIVKRAELAEFTLTESNMANIGVPFVIKPGLGYGKRGVILDATGPSDLARSIAEWPDSHYLLQRRIVPRVIGLEPAYFRIFHVFGTVWCCWWNCYNDRYRAMTPAEIEEHSLQSLRETICRLAALTRMNFFSSEIAQTEDGRFVLIDYVNDQCHMLTQSANRAIGAPDEIVAAIAEHLVKGAQRLIQQSQ